jgi:hypothetical protein
MYTRGGDQNELVFFLDTAIYHYYRCMHFYFYSTKSKMLVLLPTFIYQYRISHSAILIWQRRMKARYIVLLWDIILRRSFFCKFWGLYRGDLNPCKSYYSMGISKCCYFKCWDSQMLKNVYYIYSTLKHDIIIFMDCLQLPFHLSDISNCNFWLQVHAYFSPHRFKPSLPL